MVKMDESRETKILRYTMATIGGLATFADRIGIVEATVHSLIGQIDLLMIYCNDEPSFHNARRITPDGTVKTFRGPDVTDRGKFHFCSQLKGTDHYYLTFDDDLIYPPDYVEHTVGELNKLNDQAIVSYHGKKLVEPMQKYYAGLTERQDRAAYRVLYNVKGDHDVDMVGTGCMAFRLDYFCPENLREDMMADLEVSILAKEQGKRMVVLDHRGGWVRYHPAMATKWTIWDHYQQEDDSKQTILVNRLFRMK